MLAFQGEVSASRAAADAGVEVASELGGYFAGLGYASLVVAVLAAGDDVATALDAVEAAWRHMSVLARAGATIRANFAQAALAGGDLSAARRWADDAVATTTGWHLMVALTTRARVAIAQGEPDQAERDAHDALARAAEVEAYLYIPDTLECLASLACDGGSHREAAWLFGAAHGIRLRMGAVRFKVWDAGCEASVAAVRGALGEADFDSAWAEGAALSRGWASLTPTERDVVRLVSEGLANSDIAARLFVSPRSVQTHLTHVYAKLGVTSLVQLAQEAARQA